ncbi:MAG: hypothetical protein GWN00_33875 [Aliifodinibius sp.]|nr:hypothetical protein [Fodinibius sp.]NIY29597.1 hypothetical protein [Fodinibius sp.]
MTKQEKLRSRYLDDPLPIRLGGLAANLGRAASFSKHEGHREAVSATLQESKWFIEWTAAELEDKENAAELVRLQIQLAIWQIQSINKWNDNNWRSELGSQSQQWSQRILEMSGLLSS